MGAREEAKVEPTISVLEEVAPKFLLGIPNKEEITPSTKERVRGEEVPSSQVPNIDSLLGDIYELRYQLAQANFAHYRYWDERDHYR